MRAFAQVENKNAHLMFVGEGEGKNNLLKLTSALGLAEKVTFAGFQIDPTPFYKTADLFVLSSDYEGFGNVIVEALACGTRVVSTDCNVRSAAGWNWSLAYLTTTIPDPPAPPS